MSKEARDCYPRFYIEAVEDVVASKAEGRPIYRDVEMVEITIPGDTRSRPHFIVEDKHRERWPKHYEAFTRSHEMTTVGTPLDKWPLLSKARVMELKVLGFMTVEHVASASDGTIQALGMGGRKLREQAQTYLDDAAGGAHSAELAAQNADLIEKLARMEARLASMEEQPAKRGPGRPPKVRDERPEAEAAA